MSVGTIGYPDGQRLDQLDASQAAWTIQGTFNNLQQPPALLATQGFEYTLIWCYCTAGGLLLQWNSYVDSLAANQLGGQNYPIDSLVPAFFMAALPNFGPYSSLQLETLPGKANYTLTLNALLTNKSRPWPAFPGLPQWTATTNIAASGSLTTYAPFYWAGPGTLYIFSGGTAMNFFVESEDLHGTWSTFAEARLAASGTYQAAGIAFPQNPVRLQVFNQSGTTANSTWVFSYVPDVKGI